MPIDKERLKARQKKYRDNLTQDRKEERAAYQRRWKHGNVEKCRAYERKYYRTSASEDIKKRKWESLKKFSLENPNYAKEWAIRNRKRLAEKTRRRKLLILGRIHPNADLLKIRNFYDNVPDEMEVDHIIPIACGGWHHELNLQYLPVALNRSKRDNMFYQPAGFKGWMDVPMFLLPERAPETAAIN